MMSLLALLLTGAASTGPAPDVPPTKELFAKEDWYKGQPGKEQAFEGVLLRARRGGAGFGRFNPYRLQMKDGTREVYVGSQGQLLEPYVGKRVRLTGKAVDMEVEGREHREIWPARLEVVQEDKRKEP